MIFNLKLIKLPVMCKIYATDDEMCRSADYTPNTILLMIKEHIAMKLPAKMNAKH